MVHTKVEPAEQEIKAGRFSSVVESENQLERGGIVLDESRVLEGPILEEGEGVFSPGGLDWHHLTCNNMLLVQPEVQSTELEMAERKEQEESREMLQEYFRQPDETSVPGGSSNGVRYTVPTSSREQTNEAENGVRHARMTQTEARSMEQEIRGGIEQGNCNESRIEDLMQPTGRVNSPERHVTHAHETIGDASETKPVANTLHETKGVALLSTEIVGQATEEKKDQIWSQLMNDDVLTIGVFGMGGVGKTTLMTHIHNQLLKRPNTFTHVYWVTVSHDFSIFKLQNRIANAIGFNLSNEDDERKRATGLCNALIRKRKVVLILDDLWNRFDVKEVGIPIEFNGCKLIFTTRSLEVCRQMCYCEGNIIKLEPLSKEEAWALFKKELGNYNGELESLAKSVALECAGLPLGLRTMARSMRRVHDVSEWRNVLEELKEAEKRNDMEPEVFRILKFSYDRLSNPLHQECFLYCALFPEDYAIYRDNLIEYWIVEGMIKGKKNRQAEYDKGHDILNKLENSCLLEGLIKFGRYRYVKMHDLIRDMALQLLREKSSVMVQASAQLEELPDMEEWTEDLVRVSLMKNEILEIPSSHSPRCPKLSTLLWGSNYSLRLIANSFFQQLPGLTVLDLSNTGIDKLPDSISELVSLIALLLNRCSNLRHIPSLAKLKALKKLDLSFTKCLEEVPLGMELLSNLKYLDLSESGVMELPVGILPNLSQLQVLKLIYAGISVKGAVAKGEEVACLRKLETLECYFESLSDFNKYMESCKRTLSLSIYSFLIDSETVWLSECSISGQQDFVAYLMIKRCNIPRSLFDDSSLRCLSKLKYIDLSSCDGIKSLVTLSSSSSPDILKSLETLYLYDLENFSVIISREEASPPPFPSNGTFSYLKHFEIMLCHRVKRLFPFGLLSNLQNLEIIKVGCCYKMEEILATTEEERNRDEKNNSSSSYNLPVQFRFRNLRRLQLFNLPELKSICSGMVICDSLQEVVLIRCPKLKRIPLSFPLPSLQRIQAYPEEWWESVEWDQLGHKNLLQPIFSFWP